MTLDLTHWTEAQNWLNNQAPDFVNELVNKTTELAHKQTVLLAEKDCIINHFVELFDAIGEDKSEAVCLCIEELQKLDVSFETSTKL